ncbi:MAG: hypothetical protein L6Q54_01900 [Leptospiraceae bacterium]|nr:hypothetical protein [Leptospiraceae bacterium]MCK6379992.1 hypothetical protein [Leptospiraceae bacterium]NUM40165.1 hypothetical protein [Leptospiraceae bacterium]
MNGIFYYDINFFKKRLLQRMGIIGLIYLSFLVTNYIGVPQENKIEFLKIFLPISALLGFFFYRNFQKQMKIVRAGRIEIDGSILKQYAGTNGNCLELNLKDTKSISKDSYRSYSRLLLETEEHEYSFLNLADMPKFEEQIKSITNLEIQEANFSLKDILKKAITYFTPSFVCAFLVFYPKTNIDIKILFLVININAIFFVRSMTEHKSNSKFITDKGIQRTILGLIILVIIQIIVFAVQVYL